MSVHTQRLYTCLALGQGYQAILLKTQRNQTMHSLCGYSLHVFRHTSYYIIHIISPKNVVTGRKGSRSAHPQARMHMELQTACSITTLTLPFTLFAYLMACLGGNLQQQ